MKKFSATFLLLECAAVEWHESELESVSPLCLRGVLSLNFLVFEDMLSSEVAICECHHIISTIS